ncbi:calcineurin-like phosphoesterase C-terminal domain-containing protein [Aestuariibaculum marinum]|uniref:Calcineurin-like phosphoesterase C-terminal domain-containing protein n=1 Tax=Aestuariibaculum marinum TaxID=2683592 RepID=A0A8J6QD23_9FLAO|nr:calcineurin-like phosphoesterase family protein [Aestuariibaculum marinum]MBD0824931.1 calcineurin-like phosphoesterase C-terminal domain-containing protein [Aestuariibaculum marinum]
MSQSRRKFIKLSGLTTLGVSGLGFSLLSCSGDDEIVVDDNNSFNISGVSIPATLDVVKGSETTLTGKGFNVEDTIEFVSSTTLTSFSGIVTKVTESTFTFNIPSEFVSGSYKINILRDSNSLLLGNILINVVANTNIPDVEGKNIKGVVYCNGKGISNVTVSDGYEVTTTDAEGRYYLSSLKTTGFVFISVPGNYEVSNVGSAPQFFKRVSNSTESVEQKDFSLLEVNNENHVVLSLADWHLANRNNDLEQFTTKVLPDINETVEKYTATGTKVYALTLGDLTWEYYWESNNFGLNDYVPYMNKINAPVFNLIGNHDNDPFKTSDWDAEARYKEIIGPTYYSFNLGKVHYVVLDSIEYINSGATETSMGSRNYNERLTNDQLEWLKKDLATITDKNTPIVLAMHTPLYKLPTLDSQGNDVNKIDLANGSTLINILSDFSEVHVLSGHTHINSTVTEQPNIIDHNTAAICATWWWTGKNGYANNHVCKDGSPGGYGIWKMNGKDIKWVYKGIGYEEDYQFRTYDVNSIHITAAKYAPNSTDALLADYAGEYSSPSSNNEVLINVWKYDSQWTIEVTENNQLLPVSRVKEKDPLHIISYEAFRLNAGATPTSSFVTGKTPHLFKVTASAPDSTLEIKVTDRFGNVYTETMERPKALTVDMR